jgi:S-sulfo-L-cysteine synthase (O-acetyl-L-serine-dependent)
MSGLEASSRMRTDRTVPRAERLADAVGHTPLLPLKRVAPHDSPRVRLFAKAEWFNPGGSVKDRAALWMLRAAERAGLSRDQTLLDATSGNTGIAIAMLAAAEGYRAILCVPSNVAPDRRRILRAYGADLVLTPASDGTDGAQKAAKSLMAAEPGKYWYLDQYNNSANWQAHFESTGPEIVAQTRGTITHLVACLGTTGTFVGSGRFLRKRNPHVRLIGVQPDGPFHGIEGVKHLPSSDVPGIWDPDLADEILPVTTEDAQAAVRRLAREEGLLVGTSSGAAFDAALRLAERVRRGRIVIIFPDGGDRYLGERYWEAAS